MRSPPVGLILVRNTVTHDARVMREAATLHGLGFAVLIVGVVSTAEREPELEVGGFTVLRLAPAEKIRALSTALRARIRGHQKPDAAGPRTAPDAGPKIQRESLGGRLRRVAITVAYYIQGIRVVSRISPALIHANDYNTMWIGVIAKLLGGSRLIYDCHELWPDRNGRPEWRPWLLVCEALFMRVADATITASPGYAAEIAKRYVVPPPTVVRNVPERMHEVGLRRNRASRDALPIAAYVGGLMPGRGLEPAIRALKVAQDFRLRLVGPSSDAYRLRLRQMAEDLGVAGRVTFEPAVPPDVVLSAIADADLGLMLIEPICRSYELTLPNKLFEYVGAGLPILASDLPVIGPLVRGERLGEVVAPDDVELIAHAMQRLAEPSHNAELRDRVAAFAARVTWERERGILERVYREVCRGR